MKWMCQIVSNQCIHYLVLGVLVCGWHVLKVFYGTRDCIAIIERKSSSAVRQDL